MENKLIGVHQQDGKHEMSQMQNPARMPGQLPASLGVPPPQDHLGAQRQGHVPNMPPGAAPGGVDVNPQQSQAQQQQPPAPGAPQGGIQQEGAGDGKEGGQAQVQQMLLHVPENAKPGQRVTFAAPNGVYYQVAVPEGAKPGTPFRVAVPIVNPMNQFSYLQRMALQIQQAMNMRQMGGGYPNANGQNPVPGQNTQAPIMGVRRARKTRKDKGKPRGPYRIRSERLYAELAAQEGVVPQTGAPPNVLRQRASQQAASQKAEQQQQTRQQQSQEMLDQQQLQQEEVLRQQQAVQQSQQEMKHQFQAQQQMGMPQMGMSSEVAEPSHKKQKTDNGAISMPHMQQHAPQQHVPQVPQVPSVPQVQQMHQQHAAQEQLGIPNHMQ